jgi:hypothetical protein
MPERVPFEYVVIRVVSRVEREEFINVGVALYCRARKYLAARIALDRQRLAAFAPRLDADEIQAQLDLFPAICADRCPTWTWPSWIKRSVSAGWPRPRARWCRSSPAHVGLCDDPVAALNDLFVRLVQ